MLRKILSLLHNKIFIVGVLILIQLAVFFGIVFKLSEYFVAIYFFLIALSFIISIYIVNKDDNPTYKMTWVMLIMGSCFGGLIYLCWRSEVLGTSCRDNEAAKKYGIFWQNAEFGRIAGRRSNA